MAPEANVIGLSAPFAAKSLSRPGCGSTAMSGGLPPATAVASTVGSWSPADVYLTVTPGFVFLKPASTAWNDFCSAPDHTAITEIEPLACGLLGAASAPTPAASAPATATAAITPKRFLLMHLPPCQSTGHRRF